MGLNIVQFIKPVTSKHEIISSRERTIF